MRFDQKVFEVLLGEKKIAQAKDYINDCLSDFTLAHKRQQPSAYLNDWNTSSAFIEMASYLQNQIRHVQYMSMQRKHPDGLRIISEGDSWFAFPIIIDDIIDHLLLKYPIKSLATAGDTLASIIQKKDYLWHVQLEQPEIFLFSAGGNDVLGEASLKHILLEHSKNGKQVEDYLHPEFLEKTLTNVFKNYKEMIEDVLFASPSTIILGHGYDYAHPRKSGAWLAHPFESKNIPFDRGEQIITYLVDRFNAQLDQFQQMYDGQFRYIDLRGVVGRGRQSWYDELHPKKAGFGRAARAFGKVIQDIEGKKEKAISQQYAELNYQCLKKYYPNLLSYDLADKAAKKREFSQEVKHFFVPHWKNISFLLQERARSSTNLKCTSSKKHIEQSQGEVFQIHHGYSMEKNKEVVGLGLIYEDGFGLTAAHVLKAVIESGCDYFYISTSEYKHRQIDLKQISYILNEKIDIALICFKQVEIKPLLLDRFLKKGWDFSPHHRKYLYMAQGINIEDMKKIAFIGKKRDHLYYSCSPKKGLSGAPIFDEIGHLTGLHLGNMPEPENASKTLCQRGVAIKL